MSGTPATQRNQPHSGIHPNASLPATEMTGIVTSGPYHRAIKPGTFSTTFEFRDVPSKLRESLVSRKTVETIEAEVIKIGGYAVGLESEFREDDEGAINATFIPYLRGSNVERDLDWLSNKKLTVILTHPHRQENDIELPVAMGDEGRLVKHVRPDCWVEGRRSEPVSWYELENKGHAFGDTLYVTLQLE
ncbi:hypothetical protein HPB51_017173 [Rhipicephalus microplus]|uniref:Uncharacterized protein n=1 Tax=Rhipicephalus microplus TaxID=6941 RepID=A0A9J6EAX7_RHIMP|nr:uncharacterized protein LOC119163766 [Rhipicephalus microplus]KAH8031401.1 hypothetical protein HPB51_017173 [Rhipicephalus microplus]